MSRPIQSGDYVHISLGGSSALFVILDIRPDGIYIHPENDPQSISKLIQSESGWLVEGTTEPYELTFMAAVTPSPEKVTLTGTPDVDIEILNQLDDRSLIASCPTNSYFANLCRNDKLWANRVEKYIGHGSAQIKDPNVSWQQYYFKLKYFLSKPKRINKLVKADSILIFQWFSQLDPPILLDKKGADKAATYGRLDILQWLSQLDPPILPDEKSANAAAMRGHVNVLQWLSQFDPPILPDEEGVDDAAGYGRVNVLKWLSQLDPPILPDYSGANDAALCGSVNTLQWMAQQHPPILPSVEGIKYAAGGGHSDVLQWMSQLVTDRLVYQLE